MSEWKSFIPAYNISDPKYYPCDSNNPAPENKTCAVDIDHFGPCKKRKNYGLSRNEPCIFFKFKSDIEWAPEMYTEDEFPESMPQDLQNYVKNWKQFPLEAILFSCDGVFDGDRENMGSLLYLPHRGFLSYYFPCKQEDFCTDPVIAVQFIKPKSEWSENFPIIYEFSHMYGFNHMIIFIFLEKVVINIKCKVWVKNNIEKINFSLYVEWRIEFG